MAVGVTEVDEVDIGLVEESGRQVERRIGLLRKLGIDPTREELPGGTVLWNSLVERERTANTLAIGLGGVVFSYSGPDGVVFEERVGSLLRDIETALAVGEKNGRTLAGKGVTAEYVGLLRGYGNYVLERLIRPPADPNDERVKDGVDDGVLTDAVSALETVGEGIKVEDGLRDLGDKVKGLATEGTYRDFVRKEVMPRGLVVACGGTGVLKRLSEQENTEDQERIKQAQAMAGRSVRVLAAAAKGSEKAWAEEAKKGNSGG